MRLHPQPSAVTATTSGDSLCYMRRHELGHRHGLLAGEEREQRTEEVVKAEAAAALGQHLPGATSASAAASTTFSCSLPHSLRLHPSHLAEGDVGRGRREAGGRLVLVKHALVEPGYLTVVVGSFGAARWRRGGGAV